MHNRVELTNSWLAKIDQEFRPSFKDANQAWWRNFREGGGLSLSDEGYEFCREFLELPCWEFSTDHTNASSFNAMRLLILDRHCPCPYWIKNTHKKILFTLFSDEQAMLYKLVGNLDQYITMISRS